MNPRVRASNTRAKVSFLLKGLVVGLDGRSLTPAWTRKPNGRMYRYYMHTRENKECAGASGLPRLPATELEATVVEQMRRVWRTPEMKSRVSEHDTQLDTTINEAQVWVAMLQIDKIWEQLFPAEQQRIVRLLIEKVIVSPHNIEVSFRPNGDADLISASNGSLTVSIPIKIIRRGKCKAVTLPDGKTVQPRPWDDKPTPIQQALVRGHRWLGMLESGQAKSLTEVAEREGMDRAYVSRMVNLTTLAPDIVAAILDETLPDHVTLFDLASGTPLLWEEQRDLVSSQQPSRTNPSST